MPNVTIVEMRDIMVAMPWCSIVTVEAVTTPSWKSKKNEFFDRVLKRSRVNGMIGWIYQNSVNYQRAREGKANDFVSEPRRWGFRVPGTPFVQHGEGESAKIYLELKVQQSLETVFFDKETQAVVDSAIIFPLLREPSPGRQEVDKAVVLRDYAMTSIQSIRYCGELYTLVHETEHAHI